MGGIEDDCIGRERGVSGRSVLDERGVCEEGESGMCGFDEIGVCFGEKSWIFVLDERVVFVEV